MAKSNLGGNSDNTFMFDMGSKRIHFNEGKNRNTKERDDATTNIIFGGTNSNWEYCSFQLLNDLTAIKSLFALEDISQTNVFITAQGKGPATVKMNFGATAKFSEMCPKPVEVGRRYITFKEKESYPGINVDFHVEFPEARSLQETRMFFLTTILTIVITLFLTLTGNTIKRYWSLYKREANKAENSVHPVEVNKLNKDVIASTNSKRKKRTRKPKSNGQH